MYGLAEQELCHRRTCSPRGVGEWEFLLSKSSATNLLDLTVHQLVTAGLNYVGRICQGKIVSKGGDYFIVVFTQSVGEAGKSMRASH